MKSRIVDNVHIEISSVHIRFEDAVSFPERPFALNIQLANFTVESTNARGQRVFVDRTKRASSEDSSILYKLCSAEGFSVAWDTESIVREDASSCCDAMRRVRGHCQDFVIFPTGLEARVTKVEDRTCLRNLPRLRVGVVFGEWKMDVNSRQYYNLIRCLSHIGRLKCIGSNFQNRRPLRSVTTVPREWWAYAIACVMAANRKRFTWSSMARFVASRRTYINLCVRSST